MFRSFYALCIKCYPFNHAAFNHHSFNCAAELKSIPSRYVRLECFASGTGLRCKFMSR